MPKKNPLIPFCCFAYNEIWVGRVIEGAVSFNWHENFGVVWIETIKKWCWLYYGKRPIGINEYTFLKTYSCPLLLGIENTSLGLDSERCLALTIKGHQVIWDITLQNLVGNYKCSLLNINGKCSHVTLRFGVILKLPLTFGEFLKYPWIFDVVLKIPLLRTKP